MSVTAKVAVENAAFCYDMLYSYRVPSELEALAQPGCRVLVPFGAGNAKRLGLIFELSEADSANEKRLKSISSVTDDAPLLDGELLKLAVWLKERTFCTLFEAARAMLPSGINRKLVISYSAVPEMLEQAGLLNSDESALFNLTLKKSGFVKRDTLLSKAGLPSESTVAEELYSRGFFLRNLDAVREVGDLNVRMLRLTESARAADTPAMKLTAKQREIFDLLREVESASVKEICYFTGYTPSVAVSLEKKGIAEFFDSAILRNPYKDVSQSTDSSEIALTAEQQKAFDGLFAQLSSGEACASLLFGVTGSGKTKVYMRLVDEALKSDRGIIVMVPEIALTPQMISLFHSRYGNGVAVFHSALSVGERIDEWKRVKSGECQIVVGTRSAVFAPVKKLGLIVIDEEQEHTYKSERSPRFSSRDVARFRCAENRALLLLASATPSLESYAAALNGRYTLHTLSERYGNAVLPETVVVDMRSEPLAGEHSQLSQRLVSELSACVENGRQAILLVNRRGYNTFASCSACGHVITCPSCSISMTYHHANNRLMCHYCGYSVPFISQCPACSEHAVRYSGFGTQKIEDELSSLLPSARVLRMDADTTNVRHAHETKLGSFGSGEYDILLGTQMVAKGLDFENVTLVGVVSVDRMLYNDDYKSLERTFSLLTQVVGRSGRGKFAGKAVIQTLTPENDIISLAAAQDYPAFYRSEIGIRKQLVYPPFCDICVTAITSDNELIARTGAKRAFELLTLLSSEKYPDEKFIVLGPMPARIAKLNNRFRHRMIIKCRNTSGFRSMMAELLCEFGKDNRFSSALIYCDMNPENIL